MKAGVQAVLPGLTLKERSVVAGSEVLEVTKVGAEGGL